MHYSNGASRIYKLERRQRIVDLSGGCSHCPPHNGENYRRSHKRRNPNGWGLVPIKGKDKK